MITHNEAAFQIQNFRCVMTTGGDIYVFNNVHFILKVSVDFVFNLHDKEFFNLTVSTLHHDFSLSTIIVG